MDVSLFQFPDPRTADKTGLLAIGGDLRPATLRAAYRAGIFPWPHEGYPLLWFSPGERAVLDFSKLHIPRSLERERRRSGLRFTLDQAFDDVIEACQKSLRPGQKGTWITQEMVDAYKTLHRSGEAHSVEAWREDRLVGGMYGVAIAGVFSGESMFHREPNASKLALLNMVDHLHKRGLGWMDIQMMTPHMQLLGALNESRDAFLRRLKTTQQLGLDLF